MTKMNRMGWVAFVLALSSVGCVDNVMVGNDLDAGVPPGELPPRPDDGTSAASDAMEMSFALGDIVLDQNVGAAWRAIGLDLDGFDSMEPDFLGDCASLSYPADGHGGVDNQFGSTLWPLISGMLPSLECEVNAAHASGHGTLLVNVSEWNGESNDAQVRISFLPSLDATSDALVESDCDDVVKLGDSAANGDIESHELHTGDGMTLRPPPNMDGNDSFCANAAGRLNGDDTSPPLVEDADAYVSNGTIVFRLSPGSDFILFSGRSSCPIRLNQGAMVMPMSADFRTIENGFVAGRFPLSSLSQVGPQIGVCDPSALADTYETFVDVLASFDENADGSSACNALSVGVGFSGVRANVVGTSPMAVEPFFACDGVGPLDSLVVEYPIEACCSALPGSDALACFSHWASM